MNRIKLSVVAITTLATSAALAGSGYEYNYGDNHQNATTTPSSFQEASGYNPSDRRTTELQQAGTSYAMSHGGKSGYSMASDQKTSSDIVDTAISAGSFNTLVEAIKAAGLVDTLKGKGPFTVFAPTDEAFAKLPEGTLNSLIADKEKLVKVLTYHVVAGKVTSSDLPGKTALKSVEGSNIQVAELQVATADIATSNGVIHVVNEVLIPQM